MVCLSDGEFSGLSDSQNTMPPWKVTWVSLNVNLTPYMGVDRYRIFHKEYQINGWIHKKDMETDKKSTHCQSDDLGKRCIHRPSSFGTPFAAIPSNRLQSVLDLASIFVAFCGFIQRLYAGTHNSWLCRLFLSKIGSSCTLFPELRSGPLDATI